MEVGIDNKDARFRMQAEMRREIDGHSRLAFSRA
jgi:hypothetical protein